MDFTFAAVVSRAEALEGEPCEDTEPYKSKYAARAALEEGRKLGKLTDVEFARLDCKIGTNKYLTEEVSDGERLLRQGLAILEGQTRFSALEAATESNQEQDGDSKAVDIDALLQPGDQDHLADASVATEAASAYNFLGVIWSHRAEGNPRARVFLRRAMRICESRLGGDDSDSEVFTNTAFFLAQVETALGNASEAAHLCATTLRRQRAHNHSFQLDEWVRNAVDLADALGSHLHQSRAAAHCISAANRALAGAEAEPQDQLESLRALTARALGRLVVAELATASEEQGESLLGLRLDEREAEDEVAALLPKGAACQADIRAACKLGLRAFERAKAQFPLDGFVTERLDILRGQSTLYKAMSEGETDDARFRANQRRRDCLLAPLLEALNEEVYLKEHQEIAYELGLAATGLLCRETSAALRGKGATAIEANTRPEKVFSAEEIGRINHAALKVVRRHEHFALCFLAAVERDRSTGANEFGQDPGNDAKPYLNALYEIAHAHFKMVPPDPTNKQAKVCLLLESAKRFKRVLAEAKERLPKGSQVLKEELEVCKEMGPVIEMQLNLIRAQMGQGA